ncbi:hypothetical protein [Sulfurimonas sp.]|uniref:hypothetical protein n=1 Tax=Sulfurimonas sp. TaxID=2022749 RepID=UPI003D12DE75
MKIKILLLLMIVTQVVMANNCSRLEEVKKKKKVENSISEQQNTKSENKLIQIRFKDIKSLDKAYLKSTYKLEVQECISSGVCIFKYTGNENTDTIIQQIKQQETNVKSIKTHSKYNFKTY